MKIIFDDKIKTGIAEVDEQHETLVEIYNELESAFQKGKAHRQMSEILAKLFQYTKVHFEAEERLLAQHDYPDLAQHQFEHKRLVEKLKGFVIRYRRSDQRVSAQVVEFVRKWVVSHIMNADMAYRDHVQDRIRRSAAKVPAGTDADDD